ncbi:MAG: protein kinase domain-containing protein [Gemmatimonas sp.]|jgi:serine/threonine protein kinase|uniref:protein kinase domain-containing protein n=1 Tax=Gemmatimonas sp. TaxID=1962908 RepID=UPI0022BCFEF8|nr:protein kinase [Gemmatimonas sp.]MCZ8013982.1 protein kinase [Gemmatimonas sp.]MCZ8268845.1 protein kinase [Gemmatimonas sp.]
MSDIVGRLAAALADRYRLDRELGQGGMATVYLAHDLKHDRDVAIKVLRDDVAQTVGAERFLREIRMAARLSHPHILPLFDSGQVGDALYYVMPVVRGESLRDRLDRERMLPVADAVRIASEVAGALEHAHRSGVVHRDIKPDNILLQDGHALVADFGIGKALESVDAETATQTGVSVGTPAYMSPEQASGEAVDGRSDIYSLGCVLYEMLVGEQPFTGPTVMAVIAKRFVQAPADVTALRDGVSRPVANVVAKALARAPMDRYDTAALFVASLTDVASVPGVTTRPAPPAQSLAVMPFVNRSGDADNQFFSDGLSEDLINALTAHAGLHVASRTSAFRFRGSELDIRDIGEQLNVAWVLEGSVRRAGPKLRVTAQLVNAATGFQLWSERYDREMTDVFEIQDEIVGSIVGALVPALLASGAPATTAAVRRPTDNLEAYELYLKGRSFWHQRSPATVRVAIQCFEQAIALDPNYALAYCGLADCYGILRVYGWTRAEDNRDKAAAAVARAMELDPGLAEANFSLAFYTFYFERRWRDAERHFARARELGPRVSLHHLYSALYYAIETSPAEIHRHAQVASDLDPLSPFVQALQSTAYWIVGEFETSERLAAHALELQGDYLLGLWAHGVALTGLGRHAEGIRRLEQSVAMSRAPFFVSILGLALARGGRVAEARQLLAELDERASRGEFIPAFSRLAVHVGLGDMDGVRRELTMAVAEVTPPFSLWVSSGPYLAAFRSDPEVARLLDAWDRGDDPGAAP